MRRSKRGKGLAEKGAPAAAEKDKEAISRALEETLSVVCDRLREGAAVDISDLAALKPYAENCGSVFSKRLEKASEHEFESLLWVARKVELRSAAEAIKKAAMTKELPLVLRDRALEAAEALGAQGLGPLFEQIKAAEATKEKIEISLGEGFEEGPSWPAELAPEIKRCAPPLRRQLLELILAKAPSEYVREIAEADEEIGLELARLIGAAKGSNPVELLRLLLSRSSGKKIQKELKRAQFRLKSRGIEMPEAEARPAAPAAGPAPLGRDEGYLSGYDSEGNRVIILGLKRPLEGIYYIWGLVNDFSGLKDFASLEISRKEYRAMVEKIKAEDTVTVVEVDAAYCVHLLKEAYATWVELGGEPPAGYIEAGAILNKARRDFQRPLIYELIDYGEVAHDTALIRQTPDLLNDENVLSWLLRGDVIEKYANKFEEAETSPIVLTDYQKEERLNAIIDESLSEFFTPVNLRLMRRKLEEVAYLGHLVGEGKAARIALAAALYFDREDFQPAGHPLLLEIMEESLRQAASKAERERRIILPGSAGFGRPTGESTGTSWLKGR